MPASVAAARTRQRSGLLGIAVSFQEEDAGGDADEAGGCGGADRCVGPVEAAAAGLDDDRSWPLWRAGDRRRGPGRRSHTSCGCDEVEEAPGHRREAVERCLLRP